MPTVKMNTISAGPNGVFHPGDIRQVSASEAAELIKGGFASPVAGAAQRAIAPAGQTRTAPRVTRDEDEEDQTADQTEKASDKPATKDKK